MTIFVDSIVITWHCKYYKYSITVSYCKLLYKTLLYNNSHVAYDFVNFNQKAQTRNVPYDTDLYFVCVSNVCVDWV